MEHDLGERVSHPRGRIDLGARLAFTLRDGIEYVQYGIDAGLDVDDFAPQISFFFNSHEFFEEIAKFRAARKIWAEVMRDRFKAKNERSWKLRCRTAGVSLTAQRPIAASSAPRSGARRCAGRHQLASYQLARRGARAADRRGRDAGARTQQIIAHESGVTNIVDPLGGSFFLERLTLDMEREARR